MHKKTITVILGDGAERVLEPPFDGALLASMISPSMAKKALAVRENGTIRDLTVPLQDGAKVRILTRDDADCLDILRHDCAHLMAQAVKQLYPETQISIGPVIANGFYYDFARAEPFTPDHFAAIEKRMGEIVDRDIPVCREEVARDDARDYFLRAGEEYKVKILDDIGPDETISLYRQGDFVDLCRGPHFTSTGKVGKAFRLMKLAGAYWRGDSNNPMLQRIYGTAWFARKDLDAYVERMAEAEKRDHRKIGRAMDLFHFQDDAPGAVFWHAKGWGLFSRLVDHLRRRQEAAGYEEINTPEIIDRALWEASGHWQTFREHMYTSQTEDGRVFAVKPMNCPGGVQVFRAKNPSYRDLPMRVAEFGKVHRYEPSGALHGLMRVRAFTQDDAHIYCREDQMLDECRKVIGLVLDLYRDFGFTDVAIKFADRPERRIGDDAVWDRLEKALIDALQSLDLDYSHNPGEGAFYGPKLEFVLRDALGRDWQCGTLQVDLNMPRRLDAFYIGQDGDRHFPVMLHRAAFGSLERFIGILLEHYGGNLPLWLAPVPVMVATITGDADDYARAVHQQLRAAGVRADIDLRNEKISYKIRQHSTNRVPIIAIVGKKEEANATIALRRLGHRGQEVLALAQAIAKLQSDVAEPTMHDAVQSPGGNMSDNA